MNYKRSFFLCLMVLGFVFAGMPVLGQSVSITVSPTWVSPTSLTSVDLGGAPFPSHNTGDDYRYVSVGLYATTNVEFWALQITCTVPPSLLGTYTPDPNNSLTGGDPGDSKRIIEPGPDWGIDGTDYVMIPPSFNPTTGAMTLTISRKGQTTALGANGPSTNLLLATFNYRVKTVAGSASFGCTPIAFLNHSAAAIGTPVYTAPAALNIITGYTISGVAQYQARTDYSGIGVICTDNGSQTFSTRTSITGAWSISNIRAQGRYDCTYFGQLVDNELAPAAPVIEADVYLSVRTAVYLSNNISQRILPVVLPLGNAARYNAGDPFLTEKIDEIDISAVTSSYGTTYPATTNFGLGDVNNDKTVNRADLVLVALNIGLGAGNTWSEHLIVSAQRLSNTNLYDNRIWISSTLNPNFPNIDLRQLIPSTSRDYWPAISPDGSQLAFTRAVVTGTGSSARLFYQIFVQNADGTGTATRITPATNWSYDALAPSWSPDGNRIAFVGSSTDGIVDGYRESYNNSGDIYVVDVTGRNLRMVAENSKIYPPSWLNNEYLVFGGTGKNNFCQHSICRTWANATQPDWDNTIAFDAVDVPAMNLPQFADMPNIRNGRIYYRYRAALNETRLRVANIDWNTIWTGNPIEAFNSEVTLADAIAKVGFYHTNVNYYVPEALNFAAVSYFVDYYTMPNNDTNEIVFTDYYWNGYEYLSSPWIISNSFDTGPAYGQVPIYSKAFGSESFLSQVEGNPARIGENPETSPSAFFPLRVTFILAP